ncbi:hypothetical protein EMCRGX_G009579 [Ephydatia muelleri]
MSTMYLSNITEMDRALQHPGLVPANPWCLDSYRFYLFLIVVPLSCLEPKELGIIQATLGITRFTIIVSIILYCLAKLAESPLIEHTIPSFKIHLQLEWTHHQHHMLQSPALPSQLCSGFQCDHISVHGMYVVHRYGGNLNEVPLTKPEHHVALRALSYIIILFPTLDIISAYPLVTCSMVNNLYQVIMGRDTSQRKHSYDGLILVAMRAVVAILPIVCSLFISNLVYILKYGGLVGFLTAFFFPLALQLASQYKCVKVFGKELAPAAAARGTPLQPHVDTEMEVLKKDGEEEEGAELTEDSEDELGRGKAGKKGRSPPPVAKAKLLYITPYSIPGLSHPVAVVMTGLLGGATFEIALVSLAYSVEPKCP